MVDVSYGPDSLTYFVTRDSAEGKLSPVCDLWWLKPIRVSKLGRVAWVAGDHAESKSGHYGVYSLDNIRAWFRIVPETDRELLVCEQNVSKDAAPTKPAKRAVSKRV